MLLEIIKFVQYLLKSLFIEHPKIPESTRKFPKIPELTGKYQISTNNCLENYNLDNIDVLKSPKIPEST